MAFYDWNGDGEMDAVDDFIEYQIYDDCLGEREEEENDWCDEDDC